MIELTRGIGFKAYRKLGMTHLPKIKHLKIKKNYYFIVLGSKSLFSLLNKDEVAKIVYD